MKKKNIYIYIYIYLGDQYNSKESLNKKEGRYFKLTYIGFISRHTNNKIKGIIKKLCKEEVVLILFLYHIKLVACFQQRIKFHFSWSHGSIHICLCKLWCLLRWYSCSSFSYQDRRPTKKYLKTDKKSHIYQHLLSNENCFNSCTETAFLFWIMLHLSTNWR